MKLGKDELIAKVNEKVTDEEVKVELMEDITDSFEVADESSNGYEEKYNELLEKYKERFLKSDKEEKEEEKKDELEEKEVIDVKEI